LTSTKILHCIDKIDGHRHKLIATQHGLKVERITRGCHPPVSRASALYDLQSYRSRLTVTKVQGHTRSPSFSEVKADM